MIQALRLTKDSQASTFTFGTVECAVCGEHVALTPDRDYDLTRWEDHKSKCVQCVAYFLFARFCDPPSANHVCIGPSLIQMATFSPFNHRRRLAVNRPSLPRPRP